MLENDTAARRGRGRPSVDADPILRARNFRWWCASAAGHKPAHIALAEAVPVDRRTVERGIVAGALVVALFAESAGLDFGGYGEMALGLKNATRRRDDRAGSQREH